MSYYQMIIEVSRDNGFTEYKHYKYLNEIYEVYEIFIELKKEYPNVKIVSFNTVKLPPSSFRPE